jgi:hypothetical protein
MSLFNSISKGFGMSLGSTAAKKVTSSNIDGTFKMVWGLFKWSMIITFIFGMIQGFME